VRQLGLVLARAGAADFDEVHNLLIEASRWLETKDTDQWAKPWPDANGRVERVQKAIEAGRTWIVWDDDRPAATLTASPNDHEIWPESRRHDWAVYVRRIVVSRRHKGLGLGGQLLDWAGFRAHGEYGARWIRVDVWTTNTRLHDYYRNQGFTFCACSPIRGYPSAALFQKPADQARLPDPPLFREDPKTAWPLMARRH
jgi:ribosomal protein S18 acetylase RimI-like enzyme